LLTRLTRGLSAAVAAAMGYVPSQIELLRPPFKMPRGGCDRGVWKVQFSCANPVVVRLRREDDTEYSSYLKAHCLGIPLVPLAHDRMIEVEGKSGERWRGVAVMYALSGDYYTILSHIIRALSPADLPRVYAREHQGLEQVVEDISFVHGYIDELHQRNVVTGDVFSLDNIARWDGNPVSIDWEDIANYEQVVHSDAASFDHGVITLGVSHVVRAAENPNLSVCELRKLEWFLTTLTSSTSTDT